MEFVSHQSLVNGERSHQQSNLWRTEDIANKWHPAITSKPDPLVFNRARAINQISIQELSAFLWATLLALHTQSEEINALNGMNKITLRIQTSGRWYTISAAV